MRQWTSASLHSDPLDVDAAEAAAEVSGHVQQGLVPNKERTQAIWPRLMTLVRFAADRFRHGSE